MLKSNSIPMIPVALLSLACAPKNDVKPATEDGPIQSDEAEGTLPPMDPGDPPIEPDNNVCLTTEEPPYQGIWHQCGGSFDITLTGAALGTEIDEAITIDFGEGVTGDSYQRPRVAACCGEYDFERPFSEQTEYAENCLYDSIQQFCVALPYYVWDMAKAAGEDDKLAMRDLLNFYGNQLATGEKQFECIAQLWGAGPADPYYYAITDHSWNAIANVWVNIVVAEVNDLYLPEDPEEWISCASIFENDDTVLPDPGPDGAVLDALQLDSGSIDVSAFDSTGWLAPEPSSVLVVGEGDQGPLFGLLALDGGATRLGGVPVERWRVTTLRAVPMHERTDGALTVPAGALSFIGALVVDGDTLTTIAHNVTDLVLWPSPKGWQIEPFTAVYTSDAGDAWTLQTSELRFVAH